MTSSVAFGSAPGGSFGPSGYPPAPESVEDCGIDLGLLLDISLKTIYYGGRPSARVISQRVALPFRIVEQLLNFLRRQEYVEIVGSSGQSEPEYQYAVTSKGAAKTDEILAKNQYVGPVPVPFDDYVEMVRRQSVRDIDMTPEHVQEGLSSLVLDDITLLQVGTAINSAKSIFIYGDPGNGKTAIAELTGEMMPGAVLIPHAVEAYGQIIKVFDPRVHHRIEQDDLSTGRQDGLGHIYQDRPAIGDERWVLSRRPFVIGGGELSLADLELRFSTTSKFYIAPVQMKANNGLLVVDDFGRQLMRPDELLNRWMVPLDRQVDHLTYHTGETLEVPFDVELIFSTNLAPSRLGDEAFFRRIAHKVKIPDPDERNYRLILQRMAARTGIEYNEEAADYLIHRYYREDARPFRGVHPRDIFALIIDMGKYKRERPAFTKEWVDAACGAYFVQD